MSLWCFLVRSIAVPRPNFTRRALSRWVQRQCGPTTEACPHGAWHLVVAGREVVFVVGEKISFAKTPYDTVLKKIICLCQDSTKTSKELEFSYHVFKRPPKREGQTCKQEQQSQLKLHEGFKKELQCLEILTLNWPVVTINAHTIRYPCQPCIGGLRL